MGIYRPDPGIYRPDPGIYRPDPGIYRPDPGLFSGSGASRGTRTPKDWKQKKTFI